MPIQEPLDPLKCYCGKPTKTYDSLFRRNFCSDECSNDLMAFLGGCDASIAITKEIKETKAGDFYIKGGVVTLNPVLATHQERKASIIDKIDAEVDTQIAQDRLRAEMKKKFPGMPDSVIEAMIKAKG